MSNKEEYFLSNYKIIDNLSDEKLNFYFQLMTELEKNNIKAVNPELSGSRELTSNFYFMTVLYIFYILIEI